VYINIQNTYPDITHCKGNNHTVFNSLGKAVEQKAVFDIIDGKLAIGHLKKSIQRSILNAIYMVVYMELNGTIRANSEYIWNCLYRFAKKKKSSYILITYENFQLVQFSEIIKIK